MFELALILKKCTCLKGSLWLFVWLPDSPRHGVNQATCLFITLFASQPGIRVSKACCMRVA